MNKLTLSLTIFNILSFLMYGVNCLVAKKMADEFRRYGLNKIRVLTGALQILSSLVMIYGLYESVFAALSSLLLAIMMLAAIGTRIKVRDPVYLMLPAAFYLIANVYIFFQAMI